MFFVKLDLKSLFSKKEYLQINPAHMLIKQGRLQNHTITNLAQSLKDCTLFSVINSQRIKRLGRIYIDFIGKLS